jgi:hypothetical protein
MGVQWVGAPAVAHPLKNGTPQPGQSSAMHPGIALQLASLLAEAQLPASLSPRSL